VLVVLLLLPLLVVLPPLRPLLRRRKRRRRSLMMTWASVSSTKHLTPLSQLKVVYSWGTGIWLFSSVLGRTLPMGIVKPGFLRLV
jgi:hypothetical protein